MYNEINVFLNLDYLIFNFLIIVTSFVYFCIILYLITYTIKNINYYIKI